MRHVRAVHVLQDMSFSALVHYTHTLLLEISIPIPVKGDGGCIQVQARFYSKLRFMLNITELIILIKESEYVLLG